MRRFHCSLLLMLCTLAPARPPDQDPEEITISAIAMVRQGRMDDARTTLETAMRLLQAGGGRLTLLTTVQCNLASMARLRGDGAAAERLLQQAINTLERAHGATATGLPPILNRLGLLYNEYSLYPRAERIFRRSLSIQDLAPQPLSEDRPIALNGLAASLLAQGNRAASEEFLRQAVAAWRPIPPSPLIQSTAAACLMNLALVTSWNGRPQEALASARESVATTLQLRGRNHPDSAIALLSLAEVLARAQQLPQARTALEEALAIANQTLSTQPVVMAGFCERQAEILRRAGDKSAAKAAARQARRYRDQVAANAPGRHTVDLSELLARSRR